MPMTVREHLEYLAAAYILFSNANGNRRANVKLLKDSFYSSIKVPTSLVSVKAAELLRLKKGKYTKDEKEIIEQKLTPDHFWGRSKSAECLWEKMKEEFPPDRVSFSEYFLCSCQTILMTQAEHNKLKKVHNDWVKAYLNIGIKELVDISPHRIVKEIIPPDQWENYLIYKIENGVAVRNPKIHSKYDKVIATLQRHPLDPFE